MRLFFDQWTGVGVDGGPGGHAVCPVGRESMRDREHVTTHLHSLGGNTASEIIPS